MNSTTVDPRPPRTARTPWPTALRHAVRLVAEVAENGPLARHTPRSRTYRHVTRHPVGIAAIWTVWIAGCLIMLPIIANGRHLTET